jgi:hypothetical protein
MSATGGAAIAGGSRNRNRHLDENRFYSPPPLRKHREKQEQQRSSLSRTSSENRPGSSSDCSISSRATSDISNLDRFLEYITPHVPAQYLPKVSIFIAFNSIQLCFFYYYFFINFIYFVISRSSSSICIDFVSE